MYHIPQTDVDCLSSEGFCMTFLIFLILLHNCKEVLRVTYVCMQMSKLSTKANAVSSVEIFFYCLISFLSECPGYSALLHCCYTNWVLPNAYLHSMHEAAHYLLCSVTYFAHTLSSVYMDGECVFLYKRINVLVNGSFYCSRLWVSFRSVSVVLSVFLYSRPLFNRCFYDDFWAVNEWRKWSVLHTVFEGYGLVSCVLDGV